MESFAKDTLLDTDGRPLDPRIQAALRELVPRFRRRFVTLRDDLLVTEIFEEAGRRIAQHNATFDAAENPGAYAYRILCSVALWRRRHSSMRLERAIVRSDAGQSLIESQPRCAHGHSALSRASSRHFDRPLNAEKVVTIHSR
jgi:DNA-directed RNA polymerase specialized sigma24 family protein